VELNNLFGGGLSEEQQNLVLRDLFVHGYKPAQHCEKVLLALEEYMRVVGEELTQRYGTKADEDIADALDEN
jgi:hypothetical protein